MSMENFEKTDFGLKQEISGLNKKLDKQFLLIEEQKNTIESLHNAIDGMKNSIDALNNIVNAQGLIIKHMQEQINRQGDTIKELVAHCLNK
jgi:predicted  nucleic acid-binding Zn-ribbon protein